MRQALHIVRKDIRRLWLPIIVVLLLIAAHAVFDILSSPINTSEDRRINEAANLLSLLLTLAWWYLIAAAIYGEVLPGDRQFWITRPYSWKSLLASKVLFVVLFVNIPLLISDCFILGTQGFPVLSSLPALLLRQLPFSFLFILGAFVLGALTSGVAQFVLGWFLLFLGIIIESFLLQNGNSVALNLPSAEDSILQWIQFALLIAIALGVIVWQYATRRTWAGRGVFAVSIFVVLPAISAIPTSPRKAFLMYSSSIRPQVDLAQLHIRYDFNNFSSCTSSNPAAPGLAAIELPLQIDGLPPGTALVGSAESQISALGGSKLYSILQRSANTYCQPISIETGQFRRVKAGPITLNTSFYLTVVNDSPTVTIAPSTKVIAIPEVGFCAPNGLSDHFLLSCRAAVRPAKTTLVRLEAPGFRSEPVEMGQFRSWPDLISGLSPVQKWAIFLSGPHISQAQISAAVRQPRARLVFTVERPLGYGIKELRAENLNLERYVVTGREGLQ